MTLLVLLLAAALTLHVMLIRRGRGRERERVSRAVHELRGPLTSARLAVHALARAPDGATLAGLDSELQRAALALDDLAAARHGRDGATPSISASWSATRSPRGAPPPLGTASGCASHGRSAGCRWTVTALASRRRSPT